MDAKEARQIANLIRSHDGEKRQKAIEDLRTHRSYTQGSHQKNLDLERALTEINHAASHGSTIRHVTMDYGTSHPNLGLFAQVFGRAEALAKALTEKGFTCKVGPPHATHDSISPNGVSCSVMVEW